MSLTKLEVQEKYDAMDYCNLPQIEIDKLQAFVSLVRCGIRVFKDNEGYELIIANDQPHIFCHINGSMIGLFHANGKGANAMPHRMFINMDGLSWSESIALKGNS